MCTQGWTGDMTRVYSSLHSSDLEEELVAVNGKCTLMCSDFCMLIICLMCEEGTVDSPGI